MQWNEIPKAELHVHLEGSFKPSRALELAAKDMEHPWNGLTTGQLNQHLDTKNFDHFLEQFKMGYRLLKTARDYQVITEDLCADLQVNGAVAADILYSPGVAVQRLGISIDDVHAGIEAGLRQFPGFRARFVLDTVLNLGPDFMDKTLNAVLAKRPHFVKGFSIGGGLPDSGIDPFLFLFEKAQNAGLFCVAHSGEVDSSVNMIRLIQETDLLRIAHGIQAVHDNSALELIKKRGIAIDVSLTSNIQTGVVSNLEEHPVQVFQKRGIPFTINTDDPFYFNTNLTKEYEKAEMLLGRDVVLCAAAFSLVAAEKT